MRLRRELESRGIPLPPSNLNNVSSMNTPMNPSHQPPMLGHGSGLFNTSGGHAMLPSGLPSANGMQPPNLGDRANGAFGKFFFIQYGFDFFNQALSRPKVQHRHHLCLLSNNLPPSLPRLCLRLSSNHLRNLKTK